MVFRFCFLFVAFSFLSSCANTDERVAVADSATQKSTKPVMAGLRGLNNEMIDDRLSSMITEAQSIEMKISALIVELDKLKQTVNADKNESLKESKANTDNVIPPLPDKLKIDKSVPVINSVQNKSVVDKIAEPQISKSEVQTTPKSEVMNTGGKGVVMVRHGIHNDKTRLVFDIDGATDHKVDLDKEAGILTITFPQTAWGTATSKAFSLGQISGYEAKQTGNSTIVAMAIKNTSNVKTSIMGRSGSKPARLIVDLIK